MKHGFFSNILGVVIDWMPGDNNDIEDQTKKIVDMDLDDRIDYEND